MIKTPFHKLETGNCQSILIHILTDNRWGGVPRYALDICRHFKASGWDVSVFTKDAKAVDAPFDKEGIRLLHAPFSGLGDLGSARTLAKVLKAAPVGSTVIHAHGFRSSFTALLARKLVARKDVRIIMTRHKVARGIDSWLFRRIYRNLDAMVFVSRFARDRFLSTWHGRELPFPADRMHILGNSLNAPESAPLPQKTQGPPTALFLGPVTPGKGVETIIDALSLLKGSRIRLRIVGSGLPDYTDRLRRRAISRGVMEMIDWRRHDDDTGRHIADTDFGLLPAVAEESFGIANLEFMRAGRPQICSSNGAQPEYLTDGREGLLVPPGNPVALANAMRKLAGDPALRKRMGDRSAAAFAANHSWPRFIETLTTLYLNN